VLHLFRRLSTSFSKKWSKILRWPKIFGEVANFILWERFFFFLVDSFSKNPSNFEYFATNLLRRIFGTHWRMRRTSVKMEDKSSASGGDGQPTFSIQNVCHKRSDCKGSDSVYFCSISARGLLKTFI
jgi:hypothetical protein